MSFAKSPTESRRTGFRQRQQRDFAFFAAMEGCAGNDMLRGRDVWQYSPTVTTVTFGQLYESIQSVDKQGVESLVWGAVHEAVQHKLVAMNPQRLGTPTAAFDLHFARSELQWNTALRQRGRLQVSISVWPSLLIFPKQSLTNV